MERARGELLAAASGLAALAGIATTATGREALAALAARLDEVRSAPRMEAHRVEAERLSVLSAATKGWRTGKRDPPELLSARGRLEEAARLLPLAAAELAAAPAAAALASLVGEVERRYAEAKARAGALDFDDLLVRARDLLRDAPAVRQEVRSRVRALLVDEYQDVNGLQAELFDLLAPPEGNEGADPLLRVAVGDAKQSIYRFRGADVTVFASLIERLGSGDGQVVHLRENHRSTAGVVDLVNAVFGADPAALGVPFGPEDRLRSTREGGELPAAELLDEGSPGTGEERRSLEARAVAARAAELVAGGRRPGSSRSSSAGSPTSGRSSGRCARRAFPSGWPGAEASSRLRRCGTWASSAPPSRSRATRWPGPRSCARRSAGCPTGRSWRWRGEAWGGWPG